MKIRISNKENKTLKIVFINNPFEVIALDSKYEYWEYMR